MQILDDNAFKYLVYWRSDTWLIFEVIKQYTQSITFETTYLKSTDGSLFNAFSVSIDNTGLTPGTVTALSNELYVTYFNDNEIL